MHLIKVKNSSGRTEFINSDDVERIVVDKEHDMTMVVFKGVSFNLFDGLIETERLENGKRTFCNKI